MQQLLSAERQGAGEEFPTGSWVGSSWARPDPAGIIRRDGAVGFRTYVERYGEPPSCFVGRHGNEDRPMVPGPCDRPAAMEVYGLPMCEIHGEEAASGALEELAYDLEQELQRPMNPYVRALSPHFEAALRRGFEVVLPVVDDERVERLLLEAFPLDRDRADVESKGYAEDPDAHGRGRKDSPFDVFMSARLLLHRHMRLAFEADADWLVEMLEEERAEVAARAASALALEIEAGLRAKPAPGAPA